MLEVRSAPYRGKHGTVQGFSRAQCGWVQVVGTVWVGQKGTVQGAVRHSVGGSGGHTTGHSVGGAGGHSTGGSPPALLSCPSQALTSHEMDRREGPAGISAVYIPPT